MKTIIILLSIITISIITGCNDDNKFPYRYAHREQVPDSLRGDMARFITETVRAADQHLTTSDYEDVDDVVEEVTYSANKVYSIPVAGLEYNDPDDQYTDSWAFIPYNQLSGNQKAIFDSLKAHQQ